MVPLAPLLLFNAATQSQSDPSNCNPTEALASVSVPGVAGMNREQLDNAGTILSVGKSMNVPDSGLIVALATARQESTLRNLPGGDRDSIGLFQQRPSQGWGDAEQLANPGYSAHAFYTALMAVPGWQDMPVAEAAQAVQHSAFPDAYGQWEPMARAIVAATPGQMPAAIRAATTCATSGAASAKVGPISQKGCTNPLPGSRITQRYGVTNGRDAHGHPGVDLAGVPQETVVAACPGTIAYVGPAQGFGANLVIEDLGSGYFALYGHMNAATVTVGQRVSGGTPVGTEGWQGDVVPAGQAGMHLHFQIDTGSSWGPTSNPEVFLAAVGVHLQ